MFKKGKYLLTFQSSELSSIWSYRCSCQWHLLWLLPSAATIGKSLVMYSRVVDLMEHDYPVSGEKTIFWEMSNPSPSMRIYNQRSRIFHIWKKIRIFCMSLKSEIKWLYTIYMLRIWGESFFTKLFDKRKGSPRLFGADRVKSEYRRTGNQINISILSLTILHNNIYNMYDLHLDIVSALVHISTSWVCCFQIGARAEHLSRTNRKIKGQGFNLCASHFSKVNKITGGISTKYLTRGTGGM